VRVVVCFLIFMFVNLLRGLCCGCGDCGVVFLCFRFIEIVLRGIGFFE